MRLTLRPHDPLSYFSTTKNIKYKSLECGSCCGVAIRFMFFICSNISQNFGIRVLLRLHDTLECGCCIGRMTRFFNNKKQKFGMQMPQPAPTRLLFNLFEAFNQKETDEQYEVFFTSNCVEKQQR